MKNQRGMLPGVLEAEKEHHGDEAAGDEKRKTDRELIIREHDEVMLEPDQGDRTGKTKNNDVEKRHKLTASIVSDLQQKRKLTFCLLKALIRPFLVVWLTETLCGI